MCFYLLLLLPVGSSCTGSGHSSVLLLVVVAAYGFLAASVGMLPAGSAACPIESFVFVVAAVGKLRTGACFVVAAVAGGGVGAAIACSANYTAFVHVTVPSG